MYNSPVPRTICSPDSSTLVLIRGYDLLILRSPSGILGSSEGCIGSTATLKTDSVKWAMGLKMYASSSSGIFNGTMVAVFTIELSTPLRRTQFPAGTPDVGMLYLLHAIHVQLIVAVAISSSSPRVYPSPRTRTCWLSRAVPLMMRPQAWNCEASAVLKSFVI